MTSSVPANRSPEQIRASIEETRRELAFSVIANNFAGSPLRIIATIDDLVRAAAEGL